jgi:hypothetical protein
MARLPWSFAFNMKPIPPYSFEPAYICRQLAGIKITSRGTTEHPKIVASIFLGSSLAPETLEKMKASLAHSIGADSDLTEFYELASKDSILKYVIKDLRGMHSTGPTSIFPEAALAILLQMAPLKRSDEMMDCFIRKYGETAEFDGKLSLSGLCPRGSPPLIPRSCQAPVSSATGPSIS